MAIYTINKNKMHKIAAIISLLLFSGICLSLRAQTGSGKGNVILYISNISNSKGNIKAALFKGREGYEDKKADPVAKGRALIKDGKATVTFSDIPYGEYAVKVFHDENDDIKVNTNWIGIPTEGIGVSNNAIGTFGLQPYEKARFVLKGTTAAQYIIMKYY